MKKNTNLKNKALTRFILVTAIIILLNIISTKLHVRLDATAEKRFSLSEPTKRLLKNLNEIAVIEVYLKGSFPAGFQRLSESTREVLQQFKEYGGKNIRFEFINPIEGKTDKEKSEVFRSFSEKGITFIKLKIQQDEDEGYSEKIIFPSCNIIYNQKEMAVNLLESHLSMSPDEKLNYSESLLEYKLASTIKHLIEPDKKKIAYMVGNGELIGPSTADMLTTLEKYYDVDTVDINQNIEIPLVYSAVIECRPTVAFNDKTKFKIDQYVMHGGRMFWLIDQLRFDMDSLQTSSAGLAIDYGLNLEDMLFNYGVRINPDFIEDFQQVNPLALTVGMIDQNPDIRLIPFPYFPYSISSSKHPIVNNMDAVMFLFANSIDTIANPEIKKTILLTSSNRSRRVPAPVRVSLSSLQFKPKAEMFKEKNIPMSVLLEGKFNSIYTNRLDPAFLAVYKDSLKKDFLPSCLKDNRMIVVSDGNFFQNDFTQSRGAMECGYYKYTEQLFANKSFILNSLEYLTDDFGLLEARNKDIKLRLLDLAKIKKERIQWQLFNLVLPISIIMIFASAYFFFRKKKYEGKVD
ncbi:MAG TPA: gliding motility-associated ABC transporter substrate-binding protein GldG [Chitinophagaceae bacterium]|nr:gliding motility-associated ABC transporter substrate-binding protein GldG [Chitinophagaceae bacterium]